MIEDKITAPVGAALITINKGGSIVAAASDGHPDDMALQMGAALGLYIKRNNMQYTLEELLLLFEHGLKGGRK